MKNTVYYENQRLKSKNIVSNLSRHLKQFQWKIDELEKLKKKTDNIIQKFNINCYNYNLVEDFLASKARLERSLQISIDKLNNANAQKYSINTLLKVNYLNELLEKCEEKLKSIEKIQIGEIEKQQLNAIKMAIYNKYMLTKSEIDLGILETKFNKYKNRSFIKRWFDNFLDVEDIVDAKKENFFMQIEEINKSRNEFSKICEPQKEYQITDILVDIELFLMENQANHKYKNQVKRIIEIRNGIKECFLIDCNELKKKIIERRQSMLPVASSYKLSKLAKERKKAIMFLNKNGYTFESVQEPKTQSYSMINVINKINIISEEIESIINTK